MKTPPINETTLIIGVVAVAGLWLLLRGVGGVAKDVTQTAVKVATGAAAGVVVGIGDSVGIPDTNVDQCELDIKNGDYWAASASCPASRFIRYAVTGK